MKLCPTCDREFEEDLDACPDDGTPLVTAGRANNPRLPGVKQVSNDAAISVFELDGPRGQRFTLEQPWSVLLLDDQRVIHESTPIQPLAAGGHGHRDTLVITLRANGFLAPAA